MSHADETISPSGSPILHHAQAKGFEPARGEACLAQISAHIEQHLGPIASVFHEILSDTVHLDVHIVPPNAHSPHLRLVTSGMSDLPMTLPDGVEAPRYMELMLSLPGDWPVDQRDFDD